MEHLEHETAPTEVAVEDDQFGAVSVLVDSAAGHVRVTGDKIRTVTLTRACEVAAEPHIAIGTRNGSLLTLEVDGEAVPLEPGKGRLRRRSYAVDVTYEGVHYRLVPDDVSSSRLTRDGTYLGDFSCEGDGRVLAEWREGAEVHALDAGFAYALAAAFGTGAQPWWMLVLHTATGGMA